MYEVSNKGNVRSLCGRHGDNRILKQGIGSKGYTLVSLCDNGKQKTVNVHRLVAEAFIPNPNNYPCINHKDENKTNNAVENLEWCTYQKNNVHGKRLMKSALKRGVPVYCIELNRIFASATSAERFLGICQSTICACCKGKCKLAGGYHWRYYAF